MNINTDKAKFAISYIPNYTFYIPFTYFGMVRMGTLSKIIGFIIYYILPTSYYFLYCYGLNLEGVLTYCISLFLFFNLYEIGYIGNDTEAIKHEIHPSLRLYDYNLRHYSKYKLLIYIIRVIISMFLSLLLFRISHNSIGSFVFIVFCFWELLVFFAYNTIRNNWSLLTFIFLQTLKFVIYVFYFYPNIDSLVIIMLVLIYPVPNVIERLSYKRYGLTFFSEFLPTKSYFTKFRAWYFGICSIVFIVLNILDLLPFISYAVFLPIALFRITLFFILKKYTFKNYLQ